MFSEPPWTAGASRCGLSCDAPCSPRLLLPALRSVAAVVVAAVVVAQVVAHLRDLVRVRRLVRGRLVEFRRRDPDVAFLRRYPARARAALLVPWLTARTCGAVAAAGVILGIPTELPVSCAAIAIGVWVGSGCAVVNAAAWERTARPAALMRPAVRTPRPTSVAAPTAGRRIPAAGATALTRRPTPRSPRLMPFPSLDQKSPR